EGEVTEGLKSAGEAIKPGDNLFEMETDKVSMEVPSTTAGVLAEIRVPAGEVAPVGAVVAVIADGAAASATPAAETLSKPAPSSATTPAARPAPMAPAAAQGAAAAPIKLDPFFEVRTPQRNYGPARLAGGRSATPLARRLAAEGGIDLAAISPSGPHGRIVARDVEPAARAAPKAAPRPAAALGVALATGPSAEEVKALYRDVPFQEVPLDGMRRIIATRLVQAKQTIPHFYLTADVEIGRLIALREE